MTRSLLSTAILNSARSRALHAISRQTLMDQACRSTEGQVAFLADDGDLCFKELSARFEGREEV